MANRTVAYKLALRLIYNSEIKRRLFASYNVMGVSVVQKAKGENTNYFISFIVDRRPVITFQQCRNLADFHERIKGQPDALVGWFFYVHKTKTYVKEKGRYITKTVHVIHYKGNSKVQVIELRGDSAIKYHPVKKIGKGTYEYVKKPGHKRYLSVAFTQDGVLYPAKNIW